jgi:hypothetical protein
MRHVADGPAGSIALAQFFAQDAGQARLYRTTDGQSWARIPLPKAGDIVWSALRPIPDGYLLVGNTFRGRPRTFRSADGQTWERVTGAPWMLDAAASPDGTVVGIADEEILTTSDLADWAGPTDRHGGLGRRPIRGGRPDPGGLRPGYGRVRRDLAVPLDGWHHVDGISRA